MFELTTIVDFEAAHCLRNYPGKCSRLHGHNWQVEVTVCGTKLNDLGLLIDFRDLKATVQEILGQLDHYYLNELPAFQEINPSAENFAKYLYDELAAAPACNGLHLKSIKVWESPRSAVTYFPEA
jgi:6-pyruvoyltetrahydropterin/6-carboxytetrahydropterin synthase